MINKSSVEQVNILVVSKSIDGGTGTYLLNLLKLKNKNNNLQFNIKTLVLEKPSYRPGRKFKADYFSDKNSYPSYYRLTFQNLHKFYRELLWLRRKISGAGPQIILSIDIHSNLLVIFSKLIWFRNVKLIATTHIDLLKTLSDKSSGLIKFILLYMVKIFYEQADVLVGVSNGVSRSLKRNFHLSKAVLTVYNGIELKRVRFNLKPQSKDKIIITITRLDKQKDVENLIEAFYLLDKRLPQTKLWILGDGPKRKDLELLVKKYELQEKIYFLGWVTNIDSYLLKSSLFAFSSKREGMGYILLEAMAIGLPIISTDSPYGPREVLDNGKYGILVPMRRPDIMQKAMFTILSDKNKYDHYSKKSKERVEYFSLEKMLTGYKKIFTELISE